MQCFGGCKPQDTLAGLDGDRLVDELRSEQVARNGATWLTAPVKLRRLDVERMVAEEPQPPPWVIEGLVVAGMLTVLHGREGEGKSLLAQALAAGVAAGEDEAGLTCHRGGVVIVDAENGEHEIHRRVHALGLPGDGIEIFEADGFDLRSDLAELERVLEENRPALLVLDSFRSLWAGKENDSGEVSAVLDPLRNLVRRFGAGGLLLHHSGRSSGHYRGSSAIGSSVELGFGLARAEGDSDRQRRYLETWKCRPAIEPPRAWLRLVSEGGRVFVDAAEPAETSESETERPEQAAPVRAALRPRVLAVLTAESQSRADIARAVGKDPKDRTVGRVLDILEREGEAQRDEGGWRRVAGISGPIGGCHPATLGENPHGKADNGGGDRGSFVDTDDAFFERAKRVFPGSYELTAGVSR